VCERGPRYTHRLSGTVEPDDQVERCLELDRLPGTIIEGADPGLHELTIEILKAMTLQLTLGQPTSRLKLWKSGQQVDHECHSVRQSGNLHLRTWG
jgi:hypothetical protein